jgi:hypothetical protein
MKNYYLEFKDGKSIFNHEPFYVSEAVHRYYALRKPKLLQILAALLVYALVFMSVQLVPWLVQFLHFSNDVELGKFLVYGLLPVPFIIALVIIMRS